MRAKLFPGAIFRHYKNKLYVCITTARHTETLEEFVVYRELFVQLPTGSNDYQVWARPVDMFLETVEVEGRRVPRFKLIEKQQ